MITEKLISNIDMTISLCNKKEHEDVLYNLRDIKAIILSNIKMDLESEQFFFEQLATQTENTELNTLQYTILSLLCVYLSQIDNTKQS